MAKGSKPLTALLVAFVLLAGGCTGTTPPGATPTQVTPTPTPLPTSTPSSTPVATPDKSPSPEPSNSPEEAARAILNKMSLEEKVGQLFFIASRTNKDGTNRLTMTEDLETLIKTCHPGGFLFFAENLDTIAQTTTFIEAIKLASRYPLFMGIDEEGGLVTRLNKATALHSTKMPDAFTIGLTGNPEFAFEAARAIGEEIKSLGFNLDFAPVADVYTNPKNKVIGKRAYGTEAEPVAKMVVQGIKGFQDVGIIPVIKHFPGHGDTLSDSHTGAAIVEQDLERLRKVELVPFKAGIDAGTGMVMTAHVLTPGITSNGLPATLSPEIITGLLREELSYDGVVITDGLEMSAVSSYFEEEEAVVKALLAGVDMLLLPRDFESAYGAVFNAVQSGTISIERLDTSVLRILKLKAVYGLLDSGGEEPGNLPDPEEILGSREHQDLADKIRKEAGSK